MTNLYYYRFGRELEELLHVVDHSANYAYDATDTCTIKMKTKDRVSWRKVLLNQPIQIIRKSDDFIEFRGDAKEIRFAESDRFNLVLHLRDPTWRLAELDVKLGNGQHRKPRKLTGVTATTFTDTGGADEPPDDEPPGYVSGDNAVMIVPADEGSFVNELVEDSVTSLGTLSGGYNQINDLDPDTKAWSYNASDTVEWIQFNGSSANIKATVTGIRFSVMGKYGVASNAETFKLQYYRDDSTWQDIEDCVEIKPANAQIWAHNSPEIVFEGYIHGNDFLDGSDDWHFRLYLVKVGAPSECKIHIMSAEMDIYTDNVHTSTYFPITSYNAPSTILTVTDDPDFSINPIESGVAIGDTYIIGKKNEDLLNTILAYNAVQYKFPVTRSVDTNFTGYTAKDFVGGTILDAIEYLCDREIAHWYFDHDLNILEINKESTILLAAEHEIVEANIDTHSLEEKTDSNVKSVTVNGATYRREPDDEEQQVQFTYPDDVQNFRVGEAAKYALKNFKIDDQAIRSKSEAAKLARSVYIMRNATSVSIVAHTNTREDIWLGERLKITVDGEVYETDYPVSAITMSYSAGNNLLTQTVTGGWVRTPLIKRHANILKKITKQIRRMQKETRVIMPPAKKVVAVDGTVPMDKLVLHNPDEGDDKEIIVTGVIASEKFTFNADIFGDIEVVIEVGKFTANTVYIGDQKLSEDGELIVSDATTPGVVLKDLGHTIAQGVVAKYAIRDNTDATAAQIVMSTHERWLANYFGFLATVGNLALVSSNDVFIVAAANDGIIHFDLDQICQVKITNGTFEPETTNDIDLGTTTERFKDLYLSGSIIGGAGDPVYSQELMIGDDLESGSFTVTNHGGSQTAITEYTNPNTTGTRYFYTLNTFNPPTGYTKAQIEMLYKTGVDNRTITFQYSKNAGAVTAMGTDTSDTTFKKASSDELTLASTDVVRFTVQFAGGGVSGNFVVRSVRLVWLP